MMTSKMQPLHIKSPLVKSVSLSEQCDREIYLKLENVQPSGSFKIRGIGNLIQKSVSEGCERVVSSSGGNAGLAAAYAAWKCRIPSTVIVPETTPLLVHEKLRQLNATIQVHGKVWNEANERALEIVKENSNFCYVHPFHHPWVWEGHSSLVEEILEECPKRPSAIIVSCGGGGLVCGVLQGLHEKGAEDVTVIVMETEGANCFNAALKAGKPVNIGQIKSVATTLGALIVTPRALELIEGITVESHTVSDAEAVQACIEFADTERILVEPACGAAVAALRNKGALLKELKKKGHISSDGPVVLIVCGGSGVSLDLLDQWKEKFNL